MKTIRDWSVKKLAWNDPRNNGYHSIQHICIYKGIETLLKSGETDTLVLFRHEDYIVLLSSNSALDYAGIDVYKAYNSYNVDTYKNEKQLAFVDGTFYQSLNDELCHLYYAIKNGDFFDYEYWYQATLLFKHMRRYELI